MKTVEIRPSLREDFNILCGKPPPFTCQSFTALYRGEIAAMAGVTMTLCGYVMCMEMKPNINASKLTIWRTSKVLMSMIAQGKDVLYAAAGDKYPNSHKFLEKLGFEYFCTDEQGINILIWQRS